MPANTTPDNIPYPIGTDQITPLRTWFTLIASATQTALTAIRSRTTQRVASVAERNTVNPNPVAGTSVVRGDTGQMQTFYGGQWRPTTPFAEASGTVVLPQINNGSTGTVNVTFPAGRFTMEPKFFLSVSNSRLTPSWGTVTAAGASCPVSNWSPGPSPAGVFLHWYAVQGAPTDSAIA